MARAEWIENRQSELLHCPYFHVVFTVPEEIADIALQNKRTAYDILFRATADTLHAALKAYEDFLAIHPGHSFAAGQLTRVKASIAEPDSFIEEVGTLSELGEAIPLSLFPPYVQKLFETGKTIEAREKILAKLGELDAKTGSQVAWICYRAQAYDLACTLFLAHLRAHAWYFKYLNALESAAAKCGRVPEVVDAYRSYAAEVPSLYGRMRALARRKSS